MVKLRAALQSTMPPQVGQMSRGPTSPSPRGLACRGRRCPIAAAPKSKGHPRRRWIILWHVVWAHLVGGIAQLAPEDARQVIADVLVELAPLHSDRVLMAVFTGASQLCLGCSRKRLPKKTPCLCEGNNLFIGPHRQWTELQTADRWTPSVPSLNNKHGHNYNEDEALKEAIVTLTSATERSCSASPRCGYGRSEGILRWAGLSSS